MSLLFLLVAVVFALVILFTFGGLLFHFVTTGSLVWVIQQHLRRNLAATMPKLCGFCGGNIPAGVANCPQCGGPRDGEPPAG